MGVEPIPIRLKLIVLTVKLLPHFQVGVERFELPPSSSPMKRSTKLRYTPKFWFLPTQDLYTSNHNLSQVGNALSFC